MKPLKKELNKKNTWIVTELHHERYTFDLETSIYECKTILEILDEVYHEDPESDTWCLTEQEKKRFLPLHVGAIMIMPLDEFLKEEKYFSGSFGETNRKYGIMDYASVPVKMEEDKNNENN